MEVILQQRNRSTFWTIKKSHTLYLNPFVHIVLFTFLPVKIDELGEISCQFLSPGGIMGPKYVFGQVGQDRS